MFRRRDLVARASTASKDLRLEPLSNPYLPADLFERHVAMKSRSGRSRGSFCRGFLGGGAPLDGVAFSSGAAVGVSGAFWRRAHAIDSRRTLSRISQSIRRDARLLLFDRPVGASPRRPGPVRRAPARGRARSRGRRSANTCETANSETVTALAISCSKASAPAFLISSSGSLAVGIWITRVSVSWWTPSASAARSAALRPDSSASSDR